MKLHLIDGSGYIHRAFHALPPLTKADGTAVGALYGYCQMLNSLVEDGGYTHIAVVLDGGHSGRKDIDPDYKATRKEKAPELVAQLLAMPDATASYGVTSVKIAGYEADDVIATMAKRFAADGGDVVVYSSDKDLMQLLAEPGVGMYDPLKKQFVDEEVCRNRLGVAPHKVRDYLALVGDSADNIPGVAGIGAKGAAKLIQAHGSLHTILDIAASSPERLACRPKQAAALVSGADDALKSWALVGLQDVAGTPHHDDLAATPYDPIRLHAFLRDMEFNLMAHELAQRFALAA